MPADEGEKNPVTWGVGGGFAFYLVRGGETAFAAHSVLTDCVNTGIICTWPRPTTSLGEHVVDGVLV